MRKPLHEAVLLLLLDFSRDWLVMHTVRAKTYSEFLGKDV